MSAPERRFWRIKPAIPRDPGVLDLPQALAEEFNHLYGQRPRDLAGQDSGPVCDRGFCANVALNHLDRESAALCFSGGGIRSAAFCLGVAQALARKGLLDKFKYLSTVSGGGYTGSLLTTWAYRAANGMSDVMAGLGRTSANQRPDPVAWLRQYCSYLTPQRGILSADTWTIVTTYLRNLMLNWLILIPLLVVTVSLPRLLTILLDWLLASGWLRVDGWLWIGLAVITMVALVVSGYLLRRFTGAPDVSDGYAKATWGRVVTILIWTFAIVFSIGWYLSRSGLAVAITSLPEHVLSKVWLDNVVPEFWHWPFLLGFLGIVTGVPAALFYKAPNDVTDRNDLEAIVLGHIAAGVLIGLGIQVWMAAFDPIEITGYTALTQFLVLGPPALILVVLVAEALFLGITSKINDDYHREWWARLAGRLTKAALLWVILFGIAFWGPWLVAALAENTYNALVYVIGVLGGGAALARFAFTQGVAGAPSGETAESAWSRLGGKVFSLGAYAFVVLLLCFLIALVEQTTRPAVAWPWEPWRTAALPYSLDRIGAVVVVAIFTGVLASLIVNINKFSLHAMYRDRLIRAFLGASRARFAWGADRTRTGGHPVLDTEWKEERQFIERNANSYTDFDRDDNPIFSWLSPHKRGASMPFLVINGALNLVKTKNLAWQERKAASYTFTPLHVGSDVTKYAPAADYHGDDGGITLGTAMAISGAAVSPNAGYHSTPVMTFLLTFFNARLGWWLANPAHKAVRRKSGPTTALWPMIDELTGKTDAERDWVYVSDGGHFDNLGIYEMIRRGCRWIVAVDASADPKYEYDSLGIALRKVRIDFGVSVELLGSLRIGSAIQGQRGAHCSVFNIDYRRRLGRNVRNPGRLLYIKASHYPRAEGSPVDVRQYASGSNRFPHESTTQQFFGESQFESYRALGEWELETIVGARQNVESITDLFAYASEYLFVLQKKDEPDGDLPPAAGQDAGIESSSLLDTGATELGAD